MFSYLSPEQRVPADHPVRRMRPMVDVALKSLSPAFDEMYSTLGRPSIAPEKLLKALLLQVLYTIRSERLLMEQLGYNLLFRWFVGLNMDESVWVPTVYSGDVAEKFFAQVPHVAQNLKRSGGSAIDRRTTRHAGYEISQRKRKRIEEVFGWMKTVGMLRKTRHRGVFKVGWVFTFTAAAYNLVRMRHLLTTAVQSA